jgi:hypothetical protein
MDALSLCNLACDPHGEIIGSVLNTLGIAFSKTNINKALDFYEKAKNIAI